MKKFNVKSLAVFIFSGILLAGTMGIINIASAQETLPKGGDSFETAVGIEKGSYVTDHTIAGDSYEYFKMSIKAGQLLKVKFTTPGSGSPYAGAEMYNSERTSVQSEVIIAGSNANRTLSWMPGTEDTFYITIGNGYNKNAVGTKYAIAVEDYFDAGSETDAGGTFENAMSITPGEYTAYLSGDKGTDAKDFYKLTVDRGETLTAKVTPEGEATARIVIYNSDRQVLKDEHASNSGAIVTNSVPITEDGDVFVAVICGNYCSDELTPYTVNLATQVGAEVPAEEEEAVPGEPAGWATTEKEMEKAGKGLARLWILAWLVPVIIGLSVLVIIIVVIVILVRRKRK